MYRLEVVRLTAERTPLRAKDVPALEEIFGLKALPLAPTYFELELRGVPTAVVNALRRTLMDEMPGKALIVPTEGFDIHATTEKMMLPQMVEERIKLICLRSQFDPAIAARTRFSLDVHNPHLGTTLDVFSSDLIPERVGPAAERVGPAAERVGPAAERVGAAAERVGAATERDSRDALEGLTLFNPTLRIAVLQPGKRLVINDIRIETGYGRNHAAFHVARSAAIRPLDLAEWDDDQVRKEGGVAVDESGFKQSCLVADPRHHLLTATLPATVDADAEARAAIGDACSNIIGRLRLVAAAVSARDRPDQIGARFSVSPLSEAGETGTLIVPDETYTIGELLRRAVFDRTPSVRNVSYTVVAHKGVLDFTITHSGGVAQMLSEATTWLINTFEAIPAGIDSLRS
jgi:hypothetical protein